MSLSMMTKIGLVGQEVSAEKAQKFLDRRAKTSKIILELRMMIAIEMTMGITRAKKKMTGEIEIVVIALGVLVEKEIGGAQVETILTSEGETAGNERIDAVRAARNEMDVMIVHALVIVDRIVDRLAPVVSVIPRQSSAVIAVEPPIVVSTKPLKS